MNALICPYCGHDVPAYACSAACPHCRRQLFGVSCPQCGRKTLNLTHLTRYGAIHCFSCGADFHETPAPPRPQAVTKATLTAGALTFRTQFATLSRPPAHLVMPNAEETRTILTTCLHGFERAIAGEDLSERHRAITQHYLEAIHDLLLLDDEMRGGTVTADWLEMPAHALRVKRLCYTALWPDVGVLLPPTVQAWMLCVDDIARRWQYARRLWLAEVAPSVLPARAGGD